MKYLFCFGYEDPEEYVCNIKNGTDFESSNAVWVLADNENAAMTRGIKYASEYVERLFKTADADERYCWEKCDYAHWIERNPLQRWSGLALDSFDEITA